MGAATAHGPPVASLRGHQVSDSDHYCISNLADGGKDVISTDPSSLGLMALMMSFSDKVDERDRRTDGQARMAGLQSTMLTIPSMAGSVEAAKLGQILG